MGSVLRVEPITEDDAFIARALESASIPTLMMSMIHITRDATPRYPPFGMNSWYKNSRGRVTTTSPRRLVDYWGWTRPPDLAEYQLT